MRERPQGLLASQVAISFSASRAASVTSVALPSSSWPVTTRRKGLYVVSILFLRLAVSLLREVSAVDYQLSARHKS